MLRGDRAGLPPPQHPRARVRHVACTSARWRSPMATPPFRRRHLLCPTDFSDFSERALRHAVSVAKAVKGDLTVAYVSPYPVPLGGEVPYYASELLGSV